MALTDERRRRALVTGGASGIGEAVVRRLAEGGTEVLCADIRITADETRHLHGSTIANARLDVADYDAVRALVQAQGPFDILVNCAGVDQHQFFTNTDPAAWQHLMGVNLEGVFNTTHAVLPFMQSQQWGRIVNVASEAGRLGSRGGAVYAAAKGGVIAFTRSIARENGRKGVTANVVAPGPIDTPLLRRAVEQTSDKLTAAMVDATLLGRLGSTDEVASVVAFFCSEVASYVTGEVLGVSGGMGCGA